MRRRPWPHWQRKRASSPWRDCRPARRCRWGTLHHVDRVGNGLGTDGGAVQRIPQRQEERRDDALDRGGPRGGRTVSLPRRGPRALGHHDRTSKVLHDRRDGRTQAHDHGGPGGRQRTARGRGRVLDAVSRRRFARHQSALGDQWHGGRSAAHRRRWPGPDFRDDRTRRQGRRVFARGPARARAVSVVAAARPRSFHQRRPGVRAFRSRLSRGNASLSHVRRRGHAPSDAERDRDGCDSRSTSNASLIRCGTRFDNSETSRSRLGVTEMTTWFFEPGHTAAMFRARHMMVTYVRGHFKNVSGSLVFDPENPTQSSADVAIDAAAIWTGQPQRDAHLRSADFLDVENYPRITFKGNQVEVAGARDYILRGTLTIRGVSREVELNVSYLGQWLTPWWEDEGGTWVDKGPKVRAGFVAKTRINRHDFGVSWNDVVDKGGVVVGNTIDITIDAEAILEEQDEGAR